MKIFLICFLTLININYIFAETFSQIVFGKSQYLCDLSVSVNDNKIKTLPLKLISYNGYIKLINEKEGTSLIANVEKDLISLDEKNRTYTNHSRELKVMRENKFLDLDILLISGNKNTLISKREDGGLIEYLISNSYAKYPYKAILNKSDNTVIILNSKNVAVLKFTNIHFIVDKSNFRVPSSYISKEPKPNLNER